LNVIVVMLATALATSPSSWESSGSSSDDLSSSGGSGAGQRRPHCHHLHSNHHYHQQQQQQLEQANNLTEQQPPITTTATTTVPAPSVIPTVEEPQPMKSRGGSAGPSVNKDRSVHQIQLQLQLQHKQRQQSYVYPKLQLVQIDDAWYALNQTCLQIYQQLQMCGTAQLMPVDVVPLHKVCDESRYLYSLSICPCCNLICHPIVLSLISLLFTALDDHPPASNGRKSLRATRESYRYFVCPLIYTTAAILYSERERRAISSLLERIKSRRRHPSFPVLC
jgi:hypothetical protein